ncbi:hypothetical protein LWI29_011044 [Acer saccharum]|uniref:Protein HGH1 homolog n=1 Tax=Acer saccharum TaxID=4024 RepID=A0AA39RGX3_ACESA|nr:hypothetical protein LWI29_011044 [Acer saccharum]
MDWRAQFEAAFETLLLRLRADMAIKVLVVVNNQLMRFSTGEVQYGNRSSQVVYGLAECVHNVSRKDCEVCVEKSNDKLLKCCGGGNNYKDGGTVVVAGHCMVRYETYKFFSRVLSGGGLEASNGSSSSGAVNVLRGAAAMATELEELLEFLSSPSPPVKKAAVDIVRGLTGSEDGLQSLSSYAGIALPSLSRLLSENKEVSEPAAEALVNLSQNSELATKMVEMGMIKTVMDLLYKPDSGITQLLVMLLVNLTQLDEGISSLLQTGDEQMKGLYLMKLVRSFCRASSESSDQFEHVGSILVNISKKEAGRKILLDPKRGLLKQIIRQFDSTSLLRKKGVSGTIRNCCFEAENQLQNLLLISEFLWPALLLPVASKKVYSEQDISKMPLELGSALKIEREPVDDPEIRVQTLESIYLIILQEAGRRAFWSVNGPRILQVGYEDEEDPKVMEAFERVGSLLVDGSGTEEPSTETSK